MQFVQVDEAGRPEPFEAEPDELDRCAPRTVAFAAGSGDCGCWRSDPEEKSVSIAPPGCSTVVVAGIPGEGQRMADRHFGAVFQRIERIFAAGSVAGLSEGELLERFAARGDEAAFEAILRGMGRWCWEFAGLLRDPHDVEDAFQATFLVLVHKAGSLASATWWATGSSAWPRGLCCGRGGRPAARRASEEGGDDTMVAPGVPEGDRDRESEAMIHEEVRHLPEKYRTPVRPR